MKKWRIVYRIEEESQRILVLRVRLKEQIDYESV
jgi:mRNA-degrading endonuclease RelE of RelBE toxin-antitoxin system